MPRVRAYALGAVALAAFFGGLCLQAAGVAFSGVDSVTALAFTVGAAVGVWTYVRGGTAAARRIAVVAAGLNIAGLVMLGAASL
jgi:hypothetical protein